MDKKRVTSNIAKIFAFFWFGGKEQQFIYFKFKIMKKFILKSSIFILPLFLLFVINLLFHNKDSGDLIRLGYIYSDVFSNKNAIFPTLQKKYFTLLSEIDITQKNEFNIITIGDSFSELGNNGYKNFLASKGLSLLHIDRYISGDNPIQTLVQLINSPFFKNIKTNYIVLQSVERFFVQRNQSINFNSKIVLDTVVQKIKNYKEQTIKDNLNFFTEATLKMPLTNILYFFYSKPIFSQTYKFQSHNSSLFSNNSDNLLFYQEDLEFMNIKNDSLKILKSIEVINQIHELLENKNIKLIVLVSPDKYDLYYKFIKNNENLSKPLFFKIYEAANKKYKNIDSFRILSGLIKSEKDIYYYGDTHWSPKAANYIADEILKLYLTQIKR